MADWGDLPEGVVPLLAKRLHLIEDFISFRATCSSWRKATSLTDFDKSCPRLPLLLLDKYAYNIDKKTPDDSDDSDRDRVDEFGDSGDSDDTDSGDSDDTDSGDSDDTDSGDSDDTDSGDSDDTDSSDSGDSDMEKVDEVDEDIQIHDVSDDENDDIVADKVNYESDKGKVDEIDKLSNKGNKENSEMGDNSESDEEKSVNNVDQKNCESEKDYEIEEDNSDTDKSSEMDENSDSDSDSEEVYENDEIEEDYSDTDESTEMDDNSVVNHNRMFFSLSKGKGCMISLPEASGMECVGSKGWLIMVKRSTGDMCLFHPLTRAQILLPNAPGEVQLTILPKHVRCAVLSASPSETSDYVVMVAYAEPKYISGSCVVFCKPGIGNLTWTRVETLPPCVEDLNYYNGKFYALTGTSEVWMCDISGPNPINKAVKIIELPWKWSRKDAQLVECGGRLLIVAPFYCSQLGMQSYHDLKMVELDVIKGSYRTITSLGSSTVFLGRNEGFSVDANQFPGIIEPNRIYFSDRSYRIASRGRNNVPRPDLGLAAWGVWINF